MRYFDLALNRVRSGEQYVLDQVLTMAIPTMAVHTMAILTMASWRAVCARAGGQRRAAYYLLLTTYYLLLTTYYLLGGQRRARAACATLLAPRHRPRRRPDVRRVLASSSPSHPPPILLPSSSVSFPSPGEFCQFILLVSRWLPAHYTEKELRHMFHKSDLNGELRLSTYYYSHYYSRCSLLTTLYLLLSTLYSLLLLQATISSISTSSCTCSGKPAGSTFRASARR